MNESDCRRDIQDPIGTLSADLTACGLRPNRLKGQNYLISSRIRDRIAGCAKLCTEDVVLEIGAGTGILTWAMASQAGKVLAVEQEQSVASLLQRKFAGCLNVHVLNGDGLDVMRKYSAADSEMPLKVVSNLPYAISSPVLMTMSESPHVFSSGVLLLQREVVERATAAVGSKERCALSVLIQLRFTAVSAFRVKPTHFRPVPAVDSAVLTLERRNTDLPVPWNLVKQTVFTLFRHRRKTVFNNLRMVTDPARASQLLLDARIEAGSRAQDLPDYSFIDLAGLMCGQEKVDS